MRPFYKRIPRKRKKRMAWHELADARAMMRLLEPRIRQLVRAKGRR